MIFISIVSFFFFSVLHEQTRYPFIKITRPVYKYKTGCQFFHQDLPQMYENTRLSMENACFGTYLRMVCQKIKNPSQIGDF